jgi:hypothetical protein
MSYATKLWATWLELLRPFAWARLTRPGSRRFVEWITASALNVEEHTITQSVVAIERVADWRAWERFAEYGARGPAAVTRGMARLVEAAPGRPWHGYHVAAVDDTEVHRNSPHVRGTCTFHGDTARCPNRAATARAHNWVVLGALVEDPDRPARSLPLSGRLYFRESQLPTRSGSTGPKEPFRTECDLAVDLVREQARIVGGSPLAAFDGGCALKSAVRPPVAPEEGRPRVEFLTRSRRDARLHAPPPAERRPGQRGPTPKWGKRRPPPRQGGRSTKGWREGRAHIYGRRRQVTRKEVVCLWRVSGHGVPVKAVGARVEGHKRRFTPVTSAIGLTGLQAVELFAARFRQEDGFRDLKQRLGWEERRAWTRDPIERTSQAQRVTMSLLRLLQFRLDTEGDRGWWSPPPWNRKKGRPSGLDVGRLLRRHGPEIRRLLSEWLGDEEKVA